MFTTYHNSKDLGIVAEVAQSWDAKFIYTFENFFHPFVGELIFKLNKDSLPGMLDAVWQKDQETDFFNVFYNLTTPNDVRVGSFPKEFDVSGHGPYSNYNWELFFHIPLAIATHLSKNQRFAEAQRWFHFIFDPTSNDTSVLPPDRYWKFLAFRNGGDVTQIDELLELLSKSDLDATKQKLRGMILDGYNEIKDKPFQPHAVARTRRLAYQYCVVMKYLDNLIAWGDSLFRQDTVESINEATQRYVLAANLLGPRPQRIPLRGTARPKTFAQLKAQGLDPMGNALVELEGKFPFNLAPPQTRNGAGEDQTRSLFGIGRTLYFCIPRNDKLLGYWDTVADRLFKIRHCINIEGVVRPLALFDPPIDPGMLVKAAAAGIDIGAIVSGLNQPIGPVRSLFLIQKAMELAGEVRGLGAALLSAIEKGDSERLALLRQGHEIKIQEMAQEVRFLQCKQAQENTESLLRGRASALDRYRYYLRLLGLTPDSETTPDTLPLDRQDLTEDNFDATYMALVGQYDKAIALQAHPQLRLEVDTSPSTQSGASGKGGLYLNANENQDLNVLAPVSFGLRIGAGVSDHIFGVLALLPLFQISAAYWGVGPKVDITGGQIFSGVGQIISGALNTAASLVDSQAASASKTAGYERRADEWILQSNLAARELMQIGRQIIGSLIAEQVARHEYLNIQQQIANSKEVAQYLQDKFTNEELYTWMQGEISRLYYECYRFAFDTARKAERTMKQELMRPELDAQDFVKFNYWDGGRKGLLSGEALYLDIKRMEMAYHENNKRELELTRHVSLRQLNPVALLTLKATGSCTMNVPEWLYDRDCPGHYMRRIKSVALSIPSVTGPYASVNCALSLLRSSVRKSPLMKDGEYARQGSEDDRFVDYAGAVQSIVTSSASNDSGMFETNPRDDRFLPFEGAGAESVWKLDLPNPQDYPAFDYTTISDVILHIRYTARQGVDGARVKTALDDLFQQASQSNLALLFSLRHDFPTEWAAFAGGPGDFTATIRREHFPYFTQGKPITIVGLELYSQDVAKHHAAGDKDAATSDLAAQGQFTFTAGEDASGPTPVLTRAAGAQVFLIVNYSL